MSRNPVQEQYIADPLMGTINVPTMTDVVLEDPYKDTRGLDRIEFNPAESFNNGDSIYKILYDPIQEILKKNTGIDIDLQNGDGYSIIFDKKKNPKVEAGIAKFEAPIQKLMDQDREFSRNVYGERRKLLARDLAKEFYSLEQYIKTHPSIPEGDRGAEVRSQINKVFNETAQPAFINIVKGMTDFQGKTHAKDESFAAQRLIPSAKKLIGQSLQAYNDEISSAAGMMFGITPSSKVVEDFGKKIFETGREWTEESNERLQQLTPTGMYAQSLKDLSFLDGELNPKYAISTMSESVLPNLLSTGTGLIASAFAPTKKLKIAAGFLGGGSVGFLTESSGAYGEAKEELENIREQAQFDVKNMSPEDFADKYTYFTGRETSITADKLSDKQIDAIAKRIGVTYGMLSGGVEGLGTAIGALNLGKYLKTYTGIKNTAKALAASRFSKNTLKLADFSKSTLTQVLTEGAEEAIQESLNQLVLQRNVPFYEFKKDNLWQAAYAGGIFGGAMSAGVGGISLAQRSRDLSEERKRALELVTTENDLVREVKNPQKEDMLIKGGLLLNKSQDAIAEEISATLPGGIEGNADRIYLRANELIQQKDKWAQSSVEKTKILSNKQNRDFYDISENNLMYRDYNNAQAAAILGVDVKDLVNDFDNDLVKTVEETPADPKINMTSEIKGKKNKAKNVSRVAAFKEDNELAFMKSKLAGEVNEIAQTVRQLEQSIQEDPAYNTPKQREKLKELKEKGRQKKAEYDAVVSKTNMPVSKPKGSNVTKKQQVIDLINKIDTDKLEEISVDIEQTQVNAKKVKELNSKNQLVRSVQGKPKINNILRMVNRKQKLKDQTLDRYLQELQTIYNVYKEAGKLQDENTETNFTEKSAQTIANNQEKVIDIEALGGTILHSTSTIENMSDDELRDLAKKENLIVSEEGTIAEDPEQIKKLYQNKYAFKNLMGDDKNVTEMNMGIPLKYVLPKPSLRIVHGYFRQSWRDSKKQYSLEDYEFETWASMISDRLNPAMKEHWEDWYKNETSKPSTLVKMQDMLIEGVFGSTENISVEVTDAINEAVNSTNESLKETFAAVNSDASDIKTDSEQIINSTLFAPFKTMLPAEQVDRIVEDINRNGITFDEFVSKLSDRRLGLVNEKGETAAVLVNNNPIFRQDLIRFYNSKLPENYRPVNRGNVRGARKNLRVIVTSKGDIKEENIKYVDHETSEETVNKYDRSFLGEVMIPGLVDDYAILDKTNIRKFLPNPTVGIDGRMNFATAPRQPLDTVEILKLTKTVSEGLYPVFTRNDTGRIIFAIVKQEHREQAITYQDYWAKEREEFAKNDRVNIENFDKMIKNYDGSNFGLSGMNALAKNPAAYRAGQIARHQFLKKIYGQEYVNLTMQEMFIRNQVVFTTGSVSKNTDDFNVFVFDYKKDIPGQVKFVTEYEDGTTESIDAIQEIDGQLQYIGDGTTWTSERKLNSKYPEQVGARSTAKRSKTVFMGYDETGTMLWKHQEMAFNLPEGATVSRIMDGKNIVAEFRKDNDGVNIYVNVDGKMKYVDNIGTRDESKVMTGNFDKMNQIITLPSQSASHIQWVNKDKSVSNFPMQVLNYISDPEFLKYVSDNYNEKTPGSNISPAALYKKLDDILTDPVKMDQFIKESVKSFPGVTPRMIKNFAELGSGHHPSVMKLALAMLKNNVFKSAQDYLQRGGVLDFRASVTEKLGDNDIILPNDHGIKKNVLNRLSQLSKIKLKELQTYNLSEINALLNKYDVEIMVVRFPVPSQSGYRVMRVKKLENKLGDSFKVSPKVVKEVFEGDHDHDTGHLSIMDDKMMDFLKRNQRQTVGLNIDKYQKSPVGTDISNMLQVADLMEGFSAGKSAIGEIASLQRNYGVLRSYLNYLVVGKEKVFLRKESSMITDKDVIIEETGKAETLRLDNMLRLYAQAAFDNPKLQLLRQWNYGNYTSANHGQRKLINMMFYKENNEPLTEDEITVISKYLSYHNTASNIRDAQTRDQRTLGLKDIYGMSYEYKAFVEDRDTFIDDQQDQYNMEEDDLAFMPLISEINVKEDQVLHPHEARAIAPVDKLPSLHKVMTIMNNHTTQKQAHIEAQIRMDANGAKLQAIAAAAGYDSLQDYRNISDQERTSIEKDIRKAQTWGREAHKRLLNEYSKFSKGKQQKDIDLGAWDNSPILNKFYTDLYYKGLPRLKAYSKLNAVEQTAATYAFLGRFITKEGSTANFAGKLLPISKDDITLLDPIVMQDYFMLFNESLKEIIDKGSTKSVDDIYKGVDKMQGDLLKQHKEFFRCG